MAELLQIHKDRAPTRYALPQGVVTIGSSPSNRIHLSSPAVADRHAKIVVIGQRCVIENITHDAGTLIDDAEVDRHELSDAELIQIGQYHFQFRADESAGIVPTPRVKALLEARRNDIMRQPIPRTAAAATPTSAGTPDAPVDTDDSGSQAQTRMAGNANCLARGPEVAEEPVAEEPVAEEPVAEEPVAEEPVAEEPVAEEPALNRRTLEDLGSVPVASGSEVADDDEHPGEAARSSADIATRHPATPPIEPEGAPVDDRSPGLPQKVPAYSRSSLAATEAVDANHARDADSDPGPAFPDDIKKTGRNGSTTVAQARPGDTESPSAPPLFKTEVGGSPGTPPTNSTAEPSGRGVSFDTAPAAEPHSSSTKPPGDAVPAAVAGVADLPIGPEPAAGAARAIFQTGLPSPEDRLGGGIQRPATDLEPPARELTNGAARLEILRGANQGKRVELVHRRSVLGLHGEHAVQLQWRDGRHELSALSPHLTIRKNGALIAVQTEYLEDGDEIEFADVLLRYHRPHSSQSSSS